MFCARFPSVLSLTACSHAVSHRTALVHFGKAAARILINRRHTNYISTSTQQTKWNSMTDFNPIRFLQHAWDDTHSIGEKRAWHCSTSLYGLKQFGLSRLRLSPRLDGTVTIKESLSMPLKPLLCSSVQWTWFNWVSGFTLTGKASNCGTSRWSLRLMPPCSGFTCRLIWISWISMERQSVTRMVRWRP